MQAQQPELPMKMTEFNVQDYLATPADCAAYLQAALDDGDHDALREAVADVVASLGSPGLQSQHHGGAESGSAGNVSRPKG